MNKHLIAFAFLIISNIVSAQSWNIPSGLDFYYPMNGVCNPNGFDLNLSYFYGTNQNVGYPDSMGRSNAAMLFKNISFGETIMYNGNSYPYVPNNYSTIPLYQQTGNNYGKMTIAFMLYLPSAYYQPGGVIMTNMYGNDEGIRLSVNNGLLTFRVKDLAMTTNGTSQINNTPDAYFDARPITIQNDRWYHICIVFDLNNNNNNDDKIELFVNGEWRISKRIGLTQFIPSSIGLWNDYNYLGIGAQRKPGQSPTYNSQLPIHPITNTSATWYSGSSSIETRPLIGALDEILIYNRTLPDSDIVKLYNACTQSPAPSISNYTPTRTTVGSTITINGNNFSTTNAVAINGVAAETYEIVNPGTIRTTLTSAQATNSSGGQVTLEYVTVSTDSSGSTQLYGSLLPQPKISGLATACGIAGDSTQLRTYSIDKKPFSTYLWTVSNSNMVIAGSNSLDTVNVWFKSAFTSGILTAKRINGYDTVTKTLTITKRAPLTPGLIKGPINVCSYVGSAAGSPATYSISPVAGAVSYTWTVPAGWSVNNSGTTFTTTDTTVNITFPVNFTADLIRVTANNACGSSAQRTLGVRTSNPALLYAITGKNDVCNDMVSDTLPNGRPVTFTIRRSPNINSYLWAVPAGATITERPGVEGTSTDTIIRVVFDQTFTGGAITVRGVSGCFTTVARSYTVNRKLPITRSVLLTSSSLTCPIRTYNFGLAPTSLATNARKYLWEVTNGQSINGRDDTTFATVNFSSLLSGAYTVRVRGLNNCGFGAYGSRSFTVAVCRNPIAQIERTSGTVNDITASEPIVYPNPTSHEFTFQLPRHKISETFTVTIMDMNGKRLEQRTNQKAGSMVSLGNQYPSGTYLAVVSRGTERKTIKLVKQ